MFVDDLAQVVGACDNRPGGDALIGATTTGDVCVDFQKLTKAIFLTPDEADAFAASILKHADAIRARAGKRVADVFRPH